MFKHMKIKSVIYFFSPVKVTSPFFMVFESKLVLAFKDSLNNTLWKGLMIAEQNYFSSYFYI